MKITFKTNPEEILKTSDINSATKKINSLKESINKKIDALEIEMTVGGLSKQALMIEDYSPLYNEAREIITKYNDEFLTILDDIETNSIALTKKQREYELGLLKGKINERIEELTEKIEQEKQFNTSYSRRLVDEYTQKRKETQTKLETVEDLLEKMKQN